MLNMLTRAIRRPTIGPAIEADTSLQLQVIELRQLVAAQADQIAALTTAIQAVSRRESELRSALLAGEDLTPQPVVQQPVAAPVATPVRKIATPPLSRAAYQALVDRIRTVAATVLPPAATVAVVSKGDDELLQLGMCRGWHFPQSENGSYSGYHPRDSTVIIEHLDQLRAKGAAFVLLPSTSFWWLDHYKEFGAHLAGRRCIWQDESCRIYGL